MTVSGTSSTTSTSALVQPDNAVGKKELGKDDFLKLFITQLQYQDPMKPMDNYEMASQMAQFSSVEATTKMSDNMEKLLNYQTSQNNLQLVSLLGNGVQVTGNTIGMTDGKASPTEFVLNDPAKDIQATVYDATNQPVWQKDLGSKGAGTYELGWDGLNAAGKPVADGLYHYEIKAMSQGGETLPVDYHSSGKVTGVSFDQGVVTLTIDNLTKAKVGDILKVESK